MFYHLAVFPVWFGGLVYILVTRIMPSGWGFGVVAVLAMLVLGTALMWAKLVYNGREDKEFFLNLLSGDREDTVESHQRGFEPSSSRTQASGSRRRAPRSRAP